MSHGLIFVVLALFFWIAVSAVLIRLSMHGQKNRDAQREADQKAFEDRINSEIRSGKINSGDCYIAPVERIRTGDRKFDIHAAESEWRTPHAKHRS